MKRLIQLCMSGLLSLILSSTIVLLIIPSNSYALSAAPPATTTHFDEAQLSQILAPIALYPDPLLSHVLIAAAYHQQVAEAAELVQKNPSITKKPKVLARAMESQQWDDSVKFLVQFPDVLNMMNSQPEWTQKLGDAFLSQQAAVMDTVQKLRNKAMEQGTLNGCHQKVIAKGGVISIQPSTPREIYVPYYNPTVVYGTWWYPNYVPFVWIPPLQYRSVFLSTGFVFGFGVVIVDPLFFPIYPVWGDHYFAYGSWGGQSNWQAGTRWSPNSNFRAAALNSRTATNQSRLQNSSSSLQNASRSSTLQRGLVNNRATTGVSTNRTLSRQQSTARVAHGGGQAHASRSGRSGGFAQSHSSFRGGGGSHFGGGGRSHSGGGGGSHSGGGGGSHHR